MANLKKYRGLALLALLCAAPYPAYKYGGQVLEAAGLRSSGPPAAGLAVDPAFPGLWTDGTTVTYQDGTRLPADGYILVVVTWDDYQKNQALFQLTGSAVTESNFPVVVFGNRSGFDTSGQFKVIRRAQDGQEVPTKIEKTALVRLTVALRDGTFRVFFVDGTSAVVTAEVWHKQYMVEELPPPPPPNMPPPDELDKMTPEQLKKLGIEKLTKEEFEQRFGKLPPPPPPLKLPPVDKTEPPVKELGPAPKEAKDGPHRYKLPKGE